MLTGESWAEGVARPILFGWDEYGKGFSPVLSSVFFISFMLINSFILFNVFVAVLLDKVTAADEEQDEEEEQAAADAAAAAAATTAAGGSGGFREGSLGAAVAAAAAKPKSSSKLLEALIKGVAEEQRAQREEAAAMRELLRETLQRRAPHTPLPLRAPLVHDAPRACLPMACHAVVRAPPQASCAVGPSRAPLAPLACRPLTRGAPSVPDSPISRRRRPCRRSASSRPHPRSCRGSGHPPTAAHATTQMV